MAYERLLKTPRRRSELLHTGLLLICSVVLVGLLDWAGITHAVDRALERTYFDVRGKRDSSDRVLFVAFDKETVREWGAPPWKRQHFEKLLGTILAGEPELVALLEPGPRIMATSEADMLAPNIIAARDQGVLILPDFTEFTRPSLHMDTGSVEAVDLRRKDGTPTLMQHIIDRAKLPGPTTTTLPVNYVGPRKTLQSIAAHRVADGEFGPYNFTERIVLIGMQGDALALQVPTPVGLMSEAEVQAHAVSGLVDGVAWREIPVWSRWLVIVLLSLLGLLAVPKVPNRAVVLSAGAVIVISFTADYWLFRAGTARVGISAFLIAASFSTIIAGLLERGKTRRELTDFSRWLVERAGSDAHAGNVRSSEGEFLQKFLHDSRAFVDYHSTVFASLPPGAWHLDMRYWVDTDEEQIFERRRDIRRDPYLRAYKSHRPEWARRVFMRKELGLKTLMVPLVEMGRILGYWVVNFRKDAKVSRQKMRLIEMLGNQASIALDRRRLGRRVGPTSTGALKSPSVLLAHLRDTRHTTTSLMQNQTRVGDWLEMLPMGVLVTSLWGEIEFVNNKMRQLLKSAGVDDPMRTSLPALIARLSHDDEERVRTRMRQVMDGQPPWSIRPSRDQVNGVLHNNDFLLSRVSSADLGESDDEGADNAVAHFMLTAAEPPKAAREEPLSKPKRHKTASVGN